MNEKPENISKEELEEYFTSTNYSLSLSLGTCQVLEQLGSGGNGVVYKAKLYEKLIAIKFLLSKDFDCIKDQRLKRFLEEYINIISLDDQRSIVRYLDFDQIMIKNVQVPLILMKLCDSCLSNINRDSATAIKLFEFLMNVLERLHLYGIIHRDLKPENILLDGKEFVLADFGVAGFNPDMFTVLAETGTGERIANRLFSAPEQENPQETPKTTMDIFALGQILQWYATGSTHRGTGRKRITSVFPELEVIDRVVDKCLYHDPSERFQSIQEVRDFIKTNQEPKVDPYKYLELFDQICCQYFPKREMNIAFSDNLIKINNFFSELNQSLDKFEGCLWLLQGYGTLNISELKKTVDCTWKINNNEYEVKEIWIYVSDSTLNNFILVHYSQGKPFPKESEDEYKAYIVDDECFITESEYNSGWMETSEGTSNLSDHKVEIIRRQRKSGYFFISTLYNNVSNSDSDRINEQFISYFNQANKTPSISEVNDFAESIRKKKHPSVYIC